MDQKQTGRLQGSNEEDEPLKVFLYTDASWGKASHGGDAVGTYAIVLMTKDHTEGFSAEQIREHGVVPPEHKGSSFCELYAVKRGLELARERIKNIKSIDLYCDIGSIDAWMDKNDNGNQRVRDIRNPIIQLIKEIGAEFNSHYVNTANISASQAFHIQAHTLSVDTLRREHRRINEVHKAAGLPLNDQFKRPISVWRKVEDTMKVYLDDERVAPEGWTQVRWPEEAIELLKTGKVETISLDHCLGEGSECVSPRTGSDVLAWIQEAVETSDFMPPRMHIHTSDKEAKREMKGVAHRIWARYNEKTGRDKSKRD